jgi:8-oxo-dGTP pyrophosphatase MutT (NUDIX family)
MSARWKPSVTVAAIIERTRAGRREYLLVEEVTPEGLRLNNPAGHLEAGESPAQAVVREALEETARLFVPEALAGIYLARFVRPAAGEDVTYLRFAYGGSAGEADAARTLDAGILATHWMAIEELRACPERHRSPLVMRSIEDWAAGRRYPLELVRADASLTTPWRF